MKYQGIIHATFGLASGSALALWDVNFMNDEYFKEGCRSCGWFGDGLYRIKTGDKLTIFEYKSLPFSRSDITDSGQKIIWAGILNLIKPTQKDTDELGWEFEAIPNLHDRDLELVMDSFKCNAPAEIEC